MPALKLTAATCTVLALGLAGCTNPNGTANNTGTGALAGAAVGALAGQAIGHNDARSRAIGGMVGAVIGGAMGQNLDRQEAELRQDLSGSGARIVNTGSQLIVVLPEGITFATSSAVLDPQFAKYVRDIGQSLQRYPNTLVQVIGHTDSTGSVAYNDQLSQQRANSVANVLLGSGVSPRRINAFGVGSRQPVASNTTAAGRQQNRRVEIIITPTQ